MLSRLAESLYWIGRYVERAEDTARILDVHLQLLLEDRRVDEAAACRALLDVMGIDDLRGRDPDAGLVVALLAADPENQSSIVGSLPGRPGQRPGRPGRHLLGDVGEPQRHLPRVARPGRARRRRTARAVPVREGAHRHGRRAWPTARWSATTAGTSSILGRSLERIDMTARLLSARYGELWGPTGWVTMLRCCAAHEAYLRTHQRAVDGSLAAGFLLLDRLFPRSVYHALHTAEGASPSSIPSVERTGMADDARRILGRARTQLEFHTTDELLSDLPLLLRDIQTAAAGTGNAVADRYFRQTRALVWRA